MKPVTLRIHPKPSSLLHQVLMAFEKRPFAYQLGCTIVVGEELSLT
jgi:hypothetical protein